MKPLGKDKVITSVAYYHKSLKYDALKASHRELLRVLMLAHLLIPEGDLDTLISDTINKAKKI